MGEASESRRSAGAIFHTAASAPRAARLRPSLAAVEIQQLHLVCPATSSFPYIQLDLTPEAQKIAPTMSPVKHLG